MKPIVVNVVNVKSPRLFLQLAAELAAIFVAFANLCSKRLVKLRRIANIKALASRMNNERDANGTVDTVITPIDKACGFRHWLTTASARNGNSVVITVILTFSTTMFGGPISSTLLIAKLMADTLEMPLRTDYGLTAMFARYGYLLIGLNSRLVASYEALLTKPSVILMQLFIASTSTVNYGVFSRAMASIVEVFSGKVFAFVTFGIIHRKLDIATTGAFNKRLGFLTHFWHRCIIAHHSPNSKTSLGPLWLYGEVI